MGGTDNASNLIRLTIEEHAEAHRKLYEKHGLWQDYLAWKGLCGQIGKDEIIKEKQRLNGIERAKQNFTKPKSAPHRKKLSSLAKNRPIITCPHCGVNGPNNQMKQWHFDNCPSYTSIVRTSGPCSEKRKIAISEARKKTKKIACIYCNKLVDPGNLKRFHNENCKHKP